MGGFSARAHPRSQAEAYLDQLGIVTVALKGGLFLMGSPVDENFRDPDEVQHEVFLSPFWVMNTHLTRKQWKKITGNGPQFPPWTPQIEKDTWNQCPNCPMTNISWYEAQNAIQILSQKGVRARFLTEAEAEYVARLQGPERVITTTAYPSGDIDDVLADYVWFSGNSKNTAHPVQSNRKVFSDGIFDTHGNVYTWTADDYDPFLSGPSVDPKTTLAPGENTAKVVRGGSWGSSSRSLRSAFRSIWRPEDRSHLIGVRWVIITN
jgi:formylglycine-generating enzyme required for sulfatase activity